MYKFMRILLCVILSIILLSSSCTGTKKRLKSTPPVTENEVTVNEGNAHSESSSPIKEVEEKLIPNDEKLLDIHRYFVIIGSFRNPENAKKYQGQILKDGFSSEILKNEEGLYRVSILATDEISIARDDIRRIRSIFPKYFDTWLLVQKQ
jgi:cell division protein FtsN